MEQLTWDAIVIGAGIIGLSVARELRRQGMDVLIIERGEPGREASHAAAGMLSATDPETPTELREFARASARMYPEYVAALESETDSKIDFRRDGTLRISNAQDEQNSALTSAQLLQLEPGLKGGFCGYFSEEDNVNPRDMVKALIASAHKQGVSMVHGAAVTQCVVHDNRIQGVKTARANYYSPCVVNCAGAWSDELKQFPIPTRPIKGQMLSLAPVESKPAERLRHVIRTENVYLVPRSNGHILVGATVEDVGFDKKVVPVVAQALLKQAIALFPPLAEMRIHESWAGLRPGTPDNLPILGETGVRRYFAATGHYRNGILLAPATAVAISQIIRSSRPDWDLIPFSPLRFAKKL